MTTIKDAWVIVRGDFRADKLKLLRVLIFAILFTGYMSIFSEMIIGDVLESGDGKVLADFLLLSMTPMLGFTFSRRTMKYLSEDSYTRMLAYMRSLPVPAAVVLCKRKLHTVFSFTLNGVLYFGLIYAISGQIRSELSVPAYLAFALTWVGFALMMTGLYIFIELMVSGKTYCWLLLLIMLLSLGMALLVWEAGGNLFLYSIRYAKEWGFASPLMWATLLLGTVSVQLFSKWTIYRLKSRDLV
ncbi:hypothetical protein [Paenibacillus jilunlii]|uniref:ABC-2 type transport system permease protein n=1 Tax=Paenibacillus jilunlii TaxID=682956 RepID=A0A1G9IDB4_9BACL|nr:hypothetical protein [Paenibacillus jilunlii]KWX72857.1 hypothetical protein AML91_20715 [Paenibacillus jilunlii]SDL23207.1 hypothetical protein SAMN05216191_1028 [Paenibacillus jilunlii]